MHSRSTYLKTLKLFPGIIFSLIQSIREQVLLLSNGNIWIEIYVICTYNGCMHDHKINDSIDNNYINKWEYNIIGHAGIVLNHNNINMK